MPLPPHDDWNARRRRASIRLADAYGHENDGINRSCAVIMGIGGKPERLLNVDAAKNDGVLVLKRFSGGGTVVVDHSSLWTTFIGRNSLLPHVKPFPREIMKWSANVVFGPAFENWNKEIANDDDEKDVFVSTKERGRQTLVFQGKSCGLSGGVGESLVLPSIENKGNETSKYSSLPKFELRENDYVLGERKMGGNAQSIVSGGWLHHTSFLWDYDNMNMDYLMLPAKRPEYRGNRSHDEFLVRLKDLYGKDSTKNCFFANVKKATVASFDLEQVALNDVLKMVNEQFGGFQDWFDGKCRTKVVKL